MVVVVEGEGLPGQDEHKGVWSMGVVSVMLEQRALP